VSEQGSQTNANKPTLEQADALSSILASTTISPKQIEEYINGHDEYETEFVDFRPIWRRLQIPKDQDGAFEGFDPSSTRWRAEVIDVGNAQPNLVKAIVKISVYDGADRRYLVFDRVDASSSEEQWRFCGNIDITGNFEASEETEYRRVVSDSKHVWFVLRSQPRIGTGISRRDEMWYMLEGKPPREVLKYPVEGGRVMGNLSDLEYKANTPEPNFAGGRLSQAVRYKVSFGASNRPRFHWLFSKWVRANFLWDDDQNKFVWDRSTSNVSEEELDTTFDSWDEERFVGYNIRWFVRFARTANAEQRSWFESLIDKMPEGTQKAALTQALK